MTLLRASLALTLLLTTQAAAQTLSAPDRVHIGADVEVALAGSYDPRDFVTIVTPDTPEGRYEAYKYARSPQVTLTAPDTEGSYEIRLLAAASPYATRARRTITVDDFPASLEAPDRVDAGADFPVRWSGPGNSKDYVAWAEAGSEEKIYRAYQYTKSGNPVTLRAPDAPGSYELRYFTGGTNRLLTRRPLAVGAVSAKLEAPTSVSAGSDFSVSWSGPGHAMDFITLVRASVAEGEYGFYKYTAAGNPVTLRAPDEPGDYELRYATGQSHATLGRAPLTVSAVTASIAGPDEVQAGAEFEVRWSGPGHAADYVAVAPAGSEAGTYETWSAVSRGNPLTVRAPLAEGAYELRYSTGQSHLTLASAPLRVRPAEQRPGSLKVTGATSLSPGIAVEVILDASGSMLQRLGSQRRIEIAKETLTRLVQQTIPASVPFALRVFGKEEGSCRSDLEIPLQPIDAAAASQRIASIEARNNAKTAIATSLEQSLNDLAGASGERLLVLITDGEETCGGDPAAAIAALGQSGLPVTLNIVGFAIDDNTLRAAFRQWSELGGGNYFDGQDAEGLERAVQGAFEPHFAVLDAAGRTVGRGLVGGDAIALMPGSYTVRSRGRSTPVEIEAGKTREISL